MFQLRNGPGKSPIFILMNNNILMTNRHISPYSGVVGLTKYPNILPITNVLPRLIKKD